MRYQHSSVRGHHSFSILVKRGITPKYSFQSNAPNLATVPCHDEQVFRVWC